MNKSIFNIEECTNDEKWDEFIKSSINQNYYSLSDCISFEKSYKKYFVFKNKEVVASFSLVLDKKKIIKPIFNLYSPINYKLYPNSKSSSNNSSQFSINNAINDFFLDNFDQITNTFDYHTYDMRPFSWYGYPDYKIKFEFDIRYTLISSIDKLNAKNFMESQIYLNSSETNRREIRNSLSKSFEFKEIFSKDIFFKLKETSYKIHNKKIDNNFYKKIFLSIEKLYNKKMVKMFVGYYKGEPISMNLFSVINNKSMFLHSGRSEKLDNKNLCGVFVFFKSIIELSKLGIKILDFEGVNSPKNSFSKLKFGGTLTPYYSLKLNKYKK